MSSTLENIVECYPNQAELEPLTKENLELFIQHLRETFNEAEHLKVPGGIHGLTIYALLKEMRNISAHVDDFEFFTRSDLVFYRQCYGRLLLEIEQ